MTTHPVLDHPSSDLGRLITLIDGVFAVAMTLLVLDLKLPPGSSDLVNALKQMLPGFLVYLIAFASIAGYWIIHHSYFRYIAHGDGMITVLSLINLLFVTLYPVSTSIVGAHPQEPLATVCLSANSLLYCITAWWVWAYAASHPRLLLEKADAGGLDREARIMLFVSIGLAFAIPLAFLRVVITYIIWIFCAPLAAWLVRRRVKGKLR
jgi:uncharacterized membrane protein